MKTQIMYQHFNPYGFINISIIKGITRRTIKNTTEYFLLDDIGNILHIDLDTFETLKFKEHINEVEFIRKGV